MMKGILILFVKCFSIFLYLRVYVCIFYTCAWYLYVCISISRRIFAVLPYLRQFSDLPYSTNIIIYNNSRVYLLQINYVLPLVEYVDDVVEYMFHDHESIQLNDLTVCTEFPETWIWEDIQEG